MPIVTIVTGSLLSLLGILGYFFTDTRSLTALIPLAFGTLLELCGVLALKPDLKKHAMHGASVLALLGVLGSARGALGIVTMASGGTVARPLATQVQAAMFVICLVFLVLCIRSFREARRRRMAGATA
ncbi:MAG: hypothetical protein V4813_14605 [Gemmatimonadota bacterium]